MLSHILKLFLFSSKFYSSKDIDSNSKVFSASSSDDKSPSLIKTELASKLISSIISQAIHTIRAIRFLGTGLLLPIRFVALPSKLDSSETSYIPDTLSSDSKDEISPVSDLNTRYFRRRFIGRRSALSFRFWSWRN